jgi:hypothetical protein
MRPVNVVCMKWGTLYGPQYVNRLHAGVARHLHRPYRFVCFTDDARELAPEIEAHPLPDTGSPETADTRWRKLALFRPDLGGLSGETLFLDLDVVVVGDLEPFFGFPGVFCAVRDAQLFPDRWRRRVFKPERYAFHQRVANTSVFRFRIGAHVDALERYNHDPEGVLAGYLNEQEYLTAHLHAQGKLAFWPQDWCVSYKHGCVSRGLRSWWSDPVLPAGARVVIFAGRPKMADVVAGRGNLWYRRIPAAPWLERAWVGGEAAAGE